MENIPKYLACLNGTEERDFMHPKLQPILEDTYGVMIYQEQVMQAAQILAGYSLGAAAGVGCCCGCFVFFYFLVSPQFFCGWLFFCYCVVGGGWCGPAEIPARAFWLLPPNGGRPPTPH
jgi:hypothetical protein